MDGHRFDPKIIHFTVQGMIKMCVKKKLKLPEDIRKPIVGSESTKKSFDLGGIGGRVRL